MTKHRSEEDQASVGGRPDVGREKTQRRSGDDPRGGNVSIGQRQAGLQAKPTAALTHNDNPPFTLMRFDSASEYKEKK